MLSFSHAYMQLLLKVCEPHYLLEEKSVFK